MTPRVAFLVADGVEYVEHVTPWQAVLNAGAIPTLVSIGHAPVRSFRWPVPGPELTVDLAVADARVQDFAMLVLPGGTACPDFLRADRRAVSFVRGFADAGKPIAAICHAPWLLIDAGLAARRRVTSWPSIRIDLLNAGAEWIDSPLVDDRGVLTSRNPDDLPQFCEAIVAILEPTDADRAS